MSAPKIQPTAEQLDTLAKVATRKPIVVRAYAGCGKTTMLKMIGRANPRLAGVYLAFGRDIAHEAAREFPSNVTCSTVHSMAYRAMIRRFSKDKLGGKLSGGFVAWKLALKSAQWRNDNGQVLLSYSARGWGFLLCETVKRFCQSGRSDFVAGDVLVEGKLDHVSPELRERVKTAVLKDARHLWAQMIDPASPIPLGHDGYLKLWALSKPVIPCDFLMLDEAQDTNGVVLELVRGQRAQIITVGDAHQQIYEWRGALNAMDLLPSELEGRLTTSWRFGPTIAGYASGILRLLGETIPLQGNPAKADSIATIEGRPDAILARTNARLLGEISAAIDSDLRPYVAGGTRELEQFCDAALKLMAGQSVETPLEFFGFKDWAEVRDASEGPDGGDLQRWVKLFEDHEPAALKDLLASLPTNEADADLVLSTGHKAKGREWPRVKLCDDFLRGIGETNQDGTPKAIDPAAVAAELRLFYVAATRGKDQLEVPPTLSAKLRTLPKPEAVAAPVRLAVVPAAPVEAPADPDLGPVDFGDAPAEAPAAPVAARTSADEDFGPVILPETATAASAPAKARRRRFTDAEWDVIAEALRAVVPGLPVERQAVAARALAKIDLAA